MIKKLPIGNSKVLTYDYEAYPLTIMEAYGREHMEWMLSNYIQLSSRKDIIANKEVFLAFHDDLGLNSPFLKVQHMYWSILSEYEIEMIDFFKTNIDLGCYLYLKVDEYFIPNHYAYNRYHYIHDIMVFGYDDKNFIVLGYDDKGRYREMKVLYDTLVEAFYNNFIDKTENAWADDIYFIKYKKYNFKFNINIVKYCLFDYINSINRLERYKRFSNPIKDVVYGLEVFDKVCEYLNYLKLDKNIFYGGKNIDNRIFRIIMEHKELMLERIEFINKLYGGFGDLYDEYVQINKIASKTHFIAIKYQVTKDKKLLNVLLDNVIKIKKMDKEVLSKVYDRLLYLD